MLYKSVVCFLNQWIVLSFVHSPIESVKFSLKVMILSSVPKPLTEKITLFSEVPMYLC